MVRKPTVSGQFYSSDFGKLNKDIEYYFEDSKFGPGSTPLKTRNKKIKGFDIHGLPEAVLDVKLPIQQGECRCAASEEKR